MDRFNSSDSNAFGSAGRGARAQQSVNSLALATSPIRNAHVVSGSPVHIHKQSPSPQQRVNSNIASHAASASLKRPNQIHALPQSIHGQQSIAVESHDTRSARRARPSTSSTLLSPPLSPATVGTANMPLATSATLHAMLASYQDDLEQQQQMLAQARPDSAPETRVRKQPATVAPLASSSSSSYVLSPTALGAPSAAVAGTQSSALSPPRSFQSHHPMHQQQLSQRCAGCGALAEMCMSCFSRFKQQDGAAYKKQIARSVEVLFEKATARAFTKMSGIILQWLFGLWKTEVQRSRRRDAAAVRLLQRRRLQKLFATWHESIYRRRIVGAMLYAENQQHVARVKKREIAQLHGDVFEVTSSARVQDSVRSDELATFQALCATQQQSLVAKNQELLALRREVHHARDRLVILEQQAIDPRELAHIKSESADYKKVAFQLATALFQTMETQVEHLVASEGRHNLSHILSKETLQALDKPECQAFYNPLVELESVSMAAATNSSSNSAASGAPPDAAAAASASTTFFQSFDAPPDRAEKILIQWVNALVQKHSIDGLQTPPRMLNLHASLVDGKLFAALTKVLHHAMVKVRPKRPVGLAAVSSKLEVTSVLRENGEDLTEIAMERYLEHMRNEENAEKRLELMINTIGQALWLPVGLLNAKDIVAGDVEFNFASLAYLFATFSPCLDDAFYAVCSDLKMQLASAKSKWRDLQDGSSSSSGSGGSSSAGVSVSAPHNVKPHCSSTTSNSASKDDSDAALSSKMKLALAHTMELKRKLDVEDQKARDGHVVWSKSLRIVLRKCFLSYARLARGKAGVLTRLDAARDENDAFAKVQTTKIQDLALAFEDFAWELKLLQSYLVTIHCDLARIYRGYASRSGVVNDVITLSDVLELLTDCRALDAHCSVADVHAILKRIDPKQTSMNAHRALPPLDFLEMLIRVARKKYPAEHHRITLSEAFCLFTTNFILPFAFRADADLFRKEIEDPKIRRLLTKHSDELKDLYSKYATVELHESTKRKRARVMTAFTFSQCLIDKRIQDNVTFTSENVTAVLQNVVRTKRSESNSNSNSNSNSTAAAGAPVASASSTMDDGEVPFTAFEEAIVALACYKFPDPYISLESRIEKFIALYVRGLRSDAAVSHNKR